MFDSYEIIPSQSLVKVTYHYHPTHQEWTQMMDAIFQNPRFQPGFNFLFDKRDAGDTASNEYVEQTSQYYRQHRDKMGRCAIVVGTLLAFGMARMTEGYCLDEHVRAFIDLREAEKWLAAGDSTTDLAA